MKGLILKDLLTLKKAFKSYLILFVIYILIDMTSDQSFLTLGISFIIATMIPIAAISYDERSKWDKLVNTMPFSRREIVYSKYILGFVMIVSAFAVTFVFSKLPMEERLPIAFVTSSMCILYQAVLIPVLFKFGSEKGRIIMMVAMFVPFAAAGIIGKMLDIDGAAVSGFIDGHLTAIVVCMVVALAVIYALSVIMSVKIYSKKEF